MVKASSFVLAVLLSATATLAAAQTTDFKPVTDEMLANPSPNDWLMINRTYDEQRFSPLDQINKQTVGGLQLAWSRGLPLGTSETTPIVHDGVMYAVSPGAGVIAVNATNGDFIWEYTRDYPKDMTDFIGSAAAARSKGLAIYEDMIYFLAPDGAIVAIDAKTGKERWANVVQDYKELSQNTSAPIIVDGKVISSRTCETRAGCFISAHDAKTGKEVWKFYNTPAPGEPGGDSWGGLPAERRIASSWGLPGSYDRDRKVLYWAISNPKPWTRWKRHGNIDAVPREAPAELYSNSTVALDLETGKLKWYYQHLPGDDWDLDHVHERMLVRTKVSPDPAAVKWINPNVKPGEEHDVVLDVAEAGGIWMLDRGTGQFLWATPFPYDTPDFHISNIDVDTGRTHINWDKVKKHDGDRVLVCFHNTRSFWSTAYDPRKNAIYIPYTNSCNDMTENYKSPSGFGPRRQVMAPGADPKKYASIAKVDLSTGKIDNIYSQPIPGNGSALVTAGDVLFWGDLDRRFRAFDSDSGKILWESILGGIVSTSTITYAVNGRQYVAVMTGDAQSGTAGLLGVVKTFKAVRGHNEIYVFALPEKH